MSESFSTASSINDSDFLSQSDINKLEVSLGDEPKVLSQSTSVADEKVNKILKEFYVENVKPSCLEVECSFSELFTGGHKTEEELIGFVQKRVGQIVEKITKSPSSSNLNNLTENVTKPAALNYSNDLTYLKEELHDETFVSNLKSTDEGDYFYRNLNQNIHGSNEVLNSSATNITSTGEDDYLNRTFNRIIYGSVEVLNSSATNTTRTVMNDSLMPPSNQRHCLQKSFSSSSLSRKSLLDVRMRHEDYSYSEEKLDKWGLPKNKYSNLDQKDIIKKLTQLRDSTLAPSEVLNMTSCENHSDEEDVLHRTYTANVEDKLVPSIAQVEDEVNTKTNTGTSRGPMKAFAPLHSMTKLMGIKITSPFKKKKVEPKRNNNSACSSLSESFNERVPVAASTPSSTPTGGRSSKKDMNSSTFKFERSLSEGRMTPVKNKAGTILNVSYTKTQPSSSCQPSGLAHHQNKVSSKLPVNSRTTTFEPLKKIIKQPLLVKPKLTTSLIKRPSLAPNNTLTGRSKITGALKAEPNLTLVKKAPALRPVNSLLSKGKPAMDKKLGKHTSNLDKENKRRLN